MRKNPCLQTLGGGAREVAATSRLRRGGDWSVVRRGVRGARSRPPGEPLCSVLLVCIESILVRVLEGGALGGGRGPGVVVARSRVLQLQILEPQEIHGPRPAECLLLLKRGCHIGEGAKVLLLLELRRGVAVELTHREGVWLGCEGLRGCAEARLRLERENRGVLGLLLLLLLLHDREGSVRALWCRDRDGRDKLGLWITILWLLCKAHGRGDKRPCSRRLLEWIWMGHVQLLLW